MFSTAWLNWKDEDIIKLIEISESNTAYNFWNRFYDAIFKGFQFPDIIDWMKIRYQLVKNHILTHKDLDDRPFWEIWYYKKFYEEDIEKENERRKKEQEQQDRDSSKYSMNSMMNQTRAMMPKLPTR